MISKQYLANKAKITGLPHMPLHRYHPNQTPPTLVSLYMYSCLHLKFNTYTTKFNYLAPNQIPLSIPSFITSFSQGPKISNSVTTNYVFFSPITYFFHCSHQASPTPISHCQFNLPEHPWIKAIHTFKNSAAY